LSQNKDVALAKNFGFQLK